MNEDTKKVFAIASPVCAVISFFAFGIICSVLAVIFGAIGMTCKSAGHKTAAIIGLMAGVGILVYLLVILTAAASLIR